MKGLIFIIIVTIVVLASFARPEKEISSSSHKTELSAMKNQRVAIRDSSAIHKQGS